jgi:hypothetical protein
MSEKKSKSSSKPKKIHKFAYAEGEKEGQHYKVRNIYTTTLSQAKIKRDKKNKKDKKDKAL